MRTGASTESTISWPKITLLAARRPLRQERAVLARAVQLEVRSAVHVGRDAELLQEARDPHATRGKVDRVERAVFRGEARAPDDGSVLAP
jgi:hypothetical protein